MWRACPTWELGATANAAFRATAFTDPEIGLMDVALGPGTATGVGEDSYLLYRIVRAGYTVVYEPSAVVWHRHRDTPGALERQITGYYSGHVAHQLTTLLRDPIRAPSTGSPASAPTSSPPGRGRCCPVPPCRRISPGRSCGGRRAAR